MFSPKLEVVNYFDNLIQRIDIDIEECLEKYQSEEKTIGQLKCFWNSDNLENQLNRFRLVYFYKPKDPFKKCEYLWSESTKVVDFLNQVRMRTIEELRKAQKDTLEYLKLNSTHFHIINQNQRSEEEKIDEFKSELFKEKFYFQVSYKRNQEESLFGLFTVVTDFYMSPTEIFILEKALNAKGTDKQLFEADLKINLHERMVLIGLIQAIFLDNLETKRKLPEHVIRVSKHEILKYKAIYCYMDVNRVDLKSSEIDLSNLTTIVLNGDTKCEEVKIENFPILKCLVLRFKKPNRISIKNISKLSDLTLSLSNDVSDITDLRIDNLPDVETLNLSGNFSYIYLNGVVNLRRFSIRGNLMDDFNLDLLKSLCDQLTHLKLECFNIDDERFAKIFDGNHFPNLSNFSILSSKITRLDKKLFERFPIVQSLEIAYNKELRIDSETFSSLKQLTQLALIFNHFESIDKRLFSTLTKLRFLKLVSNGIKRIEDNAFSSLKKLRKLDLSFNNLENLSPQVFFGLRNLEDLNLNYNKLENFDLSISECFNQIEKIYLNGNSIIDKEEIANHFKHIKIQYIL